uniref:Reverse transcriptase domain-containing protein n=1 Tax=Tanacetum cinerariifolium TaxID=118510 RepID=A0A6L2L9U1_TANCI|nr:reverse transcriptase domain-containing protein [Tanacetum cinerariifolium]
MEELLQAPTEGYEEAIVIMKILAENFEIKMNLLQLVQANKFHGRENDNPHTHISNFKRMTATLKYRDVPNDAIKLMLFPCSLEDRARICNPSSVCAATGPYNQVSSPNRASHQISPHRFTPVQNNPNRFNQGQGNNFNQKQPLTLDTLPSNTIPNPKGEMKVVTTRSGLAYEEPHVLRTQSKPTIPYPSSFPDALLLMPKFASTIKSLLANKDKLFELAKIPLNENYSDMLLKKLPEKLEDPELTPTWMTLELADRSITRPKGVAEYVFVKVGKFPTDFVVVDFEADPRVPLILGRSFLRTGRALIDVYGEEITIRVNDESITFNLDQVMRYYDNSVSRVNVINIAFKEVVHDNTKSSNPTLVFESDFCEDPIVKTSPFGENILLIEKLLNEDSCQLPPMNLNQAKSPIEEPEYSFSMGYEHFITTLVTKLDKVAESSGKNLVPIPHEHEVTSDDEIEYNESIKYDSFLTFTTFTNPLFKDDFTIHDEDKQFKVYSNPLFDDDEIYSEEFSGALMPIHIAEEKRSLPSSLIPIQDNDCQMEEIDIVTNMDELLPPSFKNDDSEGEINVVEELRVDNSISNFKNELSENEASDNDNPSFPRPPPEPLDDEFDFELNSREVISALMNNNDELECYEPGGEIDIFINVKDDEYFPFTFVIRIFLPYLIYLEVFPLLFSAESEDTIFDPVIFV